MQYYEVAPTKIVRAGDDVFTYESSEILRPGHIVAIEVGRSSAVGIVVRTVKKPTFTTKPITTILESTPLPNALLSTALWVSDYYKTPLATVLQTVLPRGLTKTRRSRDSAILRGKKPYDILLTHEQKNVIQDLDQIKHGSALLHGITGSGKTAVYIDQAKKAVRAGKSVIILVPEISLTSQLVENFAAHFKNILLTHSRQTEAERHVTWQQALSATAPTIAIGPRSALFLPLSNIGLIVVDEMHEPSYKQEQAPRYSALRVASVLSQNHHAKLILGSATPPIAEYYLAKETGRPILTMNELARTHAIKPTITLVDMTKHTNFSRHRFLSNKLLVQLEKTFSDGKQALIFHNRRGSASTTLCENCGWSATCTRCFVPLTLHIDQHALRCHICGYSEHVPTSCPICDAAEIIHKGIGTKLIESELRKLFPDKKIARFDGDTDTNETVDKQYRALHDGSIDLIIGTQVIAKGLDLPELRTVGIIQADSGLSLPDYGSDERTFQLLAQVVGRVGRSHHPTSVIIQSYQPDHPSVRFGIAQNYSDFYDHALPQRKRAHFPPFRFLMKLTCTYKTEKATVQNAKKLATTLHGTLPKNVEILGPSPAFYERQRDTYRWQLILKSTSRADLAAVIDKIPSTHWQYDLDPTSLL